MAKTVLWKIPGVKSNALERLLNFINSDENRPITDLYPPEGETGRSFALRYVVLVGVESAPEESFAYQQVSLKILVEYDVRDGHGGIKRQTPRSVINEVLDRLEIFPQGS